MGSNYYTISEAYMKGQKFPHNNDVAILGVILTAAFFLRVWGIGFGLPYIYHTDEWFEIKRALKLGAGVFDFNRAAKGGLFYILFVEYGFYYFVLRVIGAAHSSADFLRGILSDPTNIWLMSRYTVAVIGVANVYLVYVLGKKAYNKTTGIVGAMFLAFSLEHIKSSHYATVDILMITLVTITFLYVLDIVYSGTQKAYVLAGVFAALAIMTKIPAIIVLLSVLMAHYMRMKKERKSNLDILRSKKMWVGFSVLLVVTAIGNPGFFKMIFKIISELGEIGHQQTKSTSDPFPIRTYNIWLFYLKSLQESFGFPLLILSLLGTIYAVCKRNVEDIILAAFIIVTYVLTCLSNNAELIYSRYSLPLHIVLPIFAARFLYEISNAFKRKEAAIFIGVLMIIIPVYNAVEHNNLISKKDTRSIAKEWVDKNIPPGAFVVIEGSQYDASYLTIPINNSPSRVVYLLDLYNKRDKEMGKEVSSKNSFYQRSIEVLKTKITYNLLLTESEFSPLKSLDDYLEKGAEYFVVRPESLKQFSFGKNYKRYPNVGNFYRDIVKGDRVVLIKRFTPRGNPGPAIDIYGLKKTSKI